MKSYPNWASLLSRWQLLLLFWFLDAGNNETVRRLGSPASEKRQCTKSRECGTRQCGECYEDRMLVAYRLAVSDARVALPNFYNIAIRIANVAARLAVLGLRLRDELGSSTSPKLVTPLNICNADIHEAAD